MVRASQPKGMRNVTSGTCIGGSVGGLFGSWRCLARCPHLLDAPLPFGGCHGCKM